MSTLALYSALYSHYNNKPFQGIVIGAVKGKDIDFVGNFEEKYFSILYRLCIQERISLDDIPMIFPESYKQPVEIMNSLFSEIFGIKLPTKNIVFVKTIFDLEKVIDAISKDYKQIKIDGTAIKVEKWHEKYIIIKKLYLQRLLELSKENNNELIKFLLWDFLVFNCFYTNGNLTAHEIVAIISPIVDDLIDKKNNDKTIAKETLLTTMKKLIFYNKAKDHDDSYRKKDDIAELIDFLNKSISLLERNIQEIDKCTIF